MCKLGGMLAVADYRSLHFVVMENRSCRSTPLLTAIVVALASTGCTGTDTDGLGFDSQEPSESSDPSGDDSDSHGAENTPDDDTPPGESSDDQPDDSDDSADPDETDPSDSNSDCNVADTGATVIRRLSRLEYELTLEELFALDERPAVEDLPQDASRDGFRVYSDIQIVSAQHLNVYMDIARELALDLMADEPRRLAVMGCALDQADCLTLLRPISSKIWRRDRGVI